MPPALMFPLSNKPVVLVTVCVIPSLLVHLIVVFTATVIVAGVNAVFCIQTSLAPGDNTAAVGAGLDFAQLPVKIVAKKNNAIADDGEGSILLNFISNSVFQANLPKVNGGLSANSLVSVWK